MPSAASTERSLHRASSQSIAMSSQQHSVRTRRRRRADADAAFGVKRGTALCPQCGESRLPCATCFIGWRVRLRDWPSANLSADAEVIAFQPGTKVHKLRLAPGPAAALDARRACRGSRAVNEPGAAA